MPERRPELAARRRASGHTQETIADHLDVDVSSVARWERGAATPSPVTRRALARELALSLDELAGMLAPPDRVTRRVGPPDRLITEHWDEHAVDDLVASLARDADPALDDMSATRVVHQWLLTSSPGTVELSGRRESRIGHSTIARISNRIQCLRNADDVLAGGDLHQVIQAELVATTALLRSAEYSEAVGRRLLAEVAALCELAGWSTADAGHPAAAEHYYLRGVSAAHAADDPVLAAHLVSSLAYQLAESGRSADALLLARSALARAESAGRSVSPTGRALTSTARALTPTVRALTPTVQALFGARLAWTLAKAGNLAESSDALRRARDDHHRRTADDPDPPWVYWLTTDEMEIIVGRCESAVGRPEQASQRLHHAVQRCDPRYAREHTLYTTWLAEAHLDAREVDRAAELAERAEGQDACIASAFSHRAVLRLNNRLARTP